MSTATECSRESGANRRILSAAAAVTAASVAVKVVAGAKEFVVAGLYGRTDAMDAFLAAVLVPGLLVNLISESMNQALAPTLIRVKELEGHDRAQELLSSAMLWVCGLLLTATLAMGVSARAFFPLVASHFAPAKLDLALHLFYALLPMVVFAGLASNCSVVLNTLDSFALPALAPAITPILILLCAPLLAARFGIWAMAYGTLAGSLLQAGSVAWMMDRHGYRFRLRWHGMNEATREVARQYGPVLLSSVVASSGLLVDQAMAAMLPPGSVSALAYANRLVNAILFLVGGALGVAVLPSLSRMVSYEDWVGCRRSVQTWVRAAALVSIPLAVGLIAGAHALVRLAFQHGAFGAHDTETVAPVLAMFAVQIPFYISSRVYYRFLVAMRRTDLVFWCGAINLLLDIALNLILMRFMGVAGIALATSLWTISTFGFLWYWTHRLLNQRERAHACVVA
ncbi:MAG: murein biosynthesis integral membrane protein MurJ [Terracidiphilus sp.]